jgi:hypothetical protein
MFRHGVFPFLAKLVLERALDLFRRDRIGEYDIHGLGLLRRDNRARRVIHRTESRLSSWGTCNGGDWHDGSSCSLLQGAFSEGRASD